MQCCVENEWKNGIVVRWDHREALWQDGRFVPCQILITDLICRCEGICVCKGKYFDAQRGSTVRAKLTSEYYRDHPSLGDGGFNKDEILTELLRLVKNAGHPWEWIAGSWHTIHKFLSYNFATTIRYFGDEDASLTFESTRIAQRLMSFIPLEPDEVMENKIEIEKCPEAMVVMANALLYGFRREPLPTDYDRATHLFAAAATLGHPGACTHLAQRNLVELNRGPRKRITDVNTPIPKSEWGSKRHINMWQLLEEAVMQDYVTPLHISRYAEALKTRNWVPSKIYVSVMEVFHEKLCQNQEISRSRVIRKCSHDACPLTFPNPSTLKLCAKCRGVEYCSSSCQVIIIPYSALLLVCESLYKVRRDVIFLFA